jgi:tetratricopeptide (TPR) repeat protein
MDGLGRTNAASRSLIVVLRSIFRLKTGKTNGRGIMLHTAPPISNRYRLMEKLGSGGMGAVYRAYDYLTGQTIALKHVLMAGDAQPVDTMGTSTTDLRLALAREFKMLASLRHPNIISVIDYGFDRERQPFVTMELVENARTIFEAARDESPVAQVRYLVQLLQALAYLHRRGIIHRDLKPANVLVNPQNVIKVLDFGIAQGGAARTRPTHRNVVGTLAYMAPELLMEDPASITSDLYAVGVIAYEIFAGVVPFTGSIGGLVNKIIQQIPDTSKIPNPKLAEVIRRLLEKDRTQRYTDALSVIQAFCDAVEMPPPIETEALRESFLQGAAFVGREFELHELSQALKKALDGNGSAWLIGGESGVGKSRLVDEVRTLALVEGALVLYGQAIAEGNVPYRLWREVIRRLVLTTDLSNDEASVVRAVVPDMAKLLPGRRLHTSTATDRNAEREKLANTITEIFKRQQQPVVLILEDLQWVTDSIELLRQLLASVSHFPWLIVGTYRDEDRPTLPEELPQMRHMKLERLSEDAIMELSTSMLGDIGKQTGVVDLLKRETEGNVLFIIEVVRQLARDSGQLDDIGRMTLPQHVFAGGMQQIIQKRLERVPASARTLLKQAALAGRQIDLDLLRTLVEFGYAPPYEQPDQIDGWLDTCAEAAVLDVNDGRWRFAHDKIREALLAELSPAEMALGHHHIASALEAVYPDVAEYAGMLAHHWQLAGDTAKELHYVYHAARYAALSGAPHQARTFCERALVLAQQHPQPLETEWYASIQRTMGWAYIGMGELGRARESFDKQLELAESIDDSSVIADALSNLASVIWRKGDLSSAREYGLQSEILYRQLADSHNIARALDILGVVSRLLGDYQVARQYVTESLTLYLAENDTDGIISARNNLGLIAQLEGKFSEALHEFKTSLAMLRAQGGVTNPITTLNHMGLISATLGEYNDAVGYFEEVLDLARENDNWRMMATVLSNLGNIAYRRGDYATARVHLNKSLAMAQDVVHLRVVSWVLEKLAAIATIFGDFPQAEAHLHESYTTAKTMGDRLLTANALQGMGMMELRRSNPALAKVHLREALVILWDIKAIPTALGVLVCLAQVAQAEGNPEQAAEWLGLVRAQEALNSETQELLAVALKSISEGLAADMLETALARGGKLALEGVITDILL